MPHLASSFDNDSLFGTCRSFLFKRNSDKMSVSVLATTSYSEAVELPLNELL
jgi:hypothetical protein